MRTKHSGQDWGQTLIFTYKHRHDCPTDNKRQRLGSAAVSQHIALISATVSRLSALIKGDKKTKILKQGPDLLL